MDQLLHVWLSLSGLSDVCVHTLWCVLHELESELSHEQVTLLCVPHAAPLTDVLVISSERSCSLVTSLALPAAPAPLISTTQAQFGLQALIFPTKQKMTR